MRAAQAAVVGAVRFRGWRSSAVLVVFAGLLQGSWNEHDSYHWVRPSRAIGTTATYKKLSAARRSRDKRLCEHGPGVVAWLGGPSTA